MRLHVAALLFTLGLALSAQAAGLDKISRAERTFIEQQEPARVREALDRLQVEKFQLGLDRDTDFTVRTSFTDAFGQTHVRVKQVWRGVPVWGSEGVLHVDRDGGALETTEDFSRGIHVDLEARTTREQALQIAEGHFQLKGALRGAPQPQLVIVPITKMIPLVHRRALNAVEQYKQTLGHALAWHVHLATENRLDGTRRRDYLIDAKSGKILRSWSSLETGAATGTGHSQWTGTVNLDTSTATGGYELRDQTRGNGTGNETRDMANGFDTNTDSNQVAHGNAIIDADNTWGDGNQYFTNLSTTSTTGQTAAVDAHHGLAATWDYYGHIHGRNGIDGLGTATFNRVHYSEDGNSFDNAFWDDDCFCMTYGDGARTSASDLADDGTLTAIDVAGHEMSHGVTSKTSGLIYDGESGGLNEATSDIHGTMVEFYSRQSNPDAIGDNTGSGGGNWTIGEQLSSVPLRFMYKPSLDGNSADEWSADLGTLDPHYSSGPMNRAFYFLSAGATKTGDTSSKYLPDGMTGIGNDKAADIHYRAQTTYLVPSSDYHSMRSAFLRAARDLFGFGSTEFTAVQNAFAGINVGYSNGTFDDLVPPTVTATETGTAGTITLAATATDNVGVAYVEFHIDGNATPAVGQSTSAPFSVTYDSSQLTDGAHKLTAIAFDGAGNAGISPEVSFTITSGFTNPLVNGGFEDVNSSGTLGWTTSTTDKSGISPIDYDDFFGPATHQGLGMAWLGDWDNGGSTTKTTTDTLSQTFTIPSGASPVFLRFWLDAEADPGDPGDTLTVNIRTAAGTTTIATITGAQTYGGYLPFQYDISAFAGQTVKLVVVAKDTGANPQNWFMDDFSVRAYTIPPQGTPTVQAFESGVKGTISLSALVTDDHLTSKVDFSIDGNKVATVTTQPWNTTYNSASLAYGNHILTATATNSANTATTSSPVSFFIDQSQTTPSPLGNPSFEFTSGTTEATGSGVTAAPWVLTKSKTSDGNDWCNEFIDGIAYDGFRAAVFNGCGTSTAKLTQAFTVPNTTRALMSFQFAVIPEGSPAGSLVLSVRDSTCATVKTTLRTWTQADDTDFTWTTRTFDLGAYKGQQICLQFDAAQTSAVDPVRFYVDDFTWVTSTNADTAAPVVTASIDGSSGNLALHAHAVDDSKLTKVEFFIDNTSVHAVNEEGADAFEDYTYDSTGLSNGAHTLVVKATDASSNVGSSPAVNFEVHNTPPDHNAPTVTASVTGTYVMNADAHDDTAVAEVDFFIDGTFAGSATDAPYSKPVLLTLTPGTHQLVARAIDVFGNHADSAPVSFGADAVTISIDPASTNVGTGDAVTFHAVLGNTANPLVSWSVTEGASAGIIDAGGVFTASTSTGTYHIVAHPAVAPSLTGNATVRVWTCDFDNDSNVDGLDMERFAKSFGTHTGDAAFDAQTDFNGDGTIDDADIALFLTRFGR